MNTPFELLEGGLGEDYMMPGQLKEYDQQKDMHLRNGPAHFKLVFVVQWISMNKFIILGV